MPKETIPSIPNSGNYDLKIGWQGGSQVQVGMENAAGFSLVSTLYGDPEALSKIGDRIADMFGVAHQDSDTAMRNGRRILDVIEASVTNPNGSYTGIWGALDRDGCNAAIRILRRARNSAYGADE